MSDETIQGEGGKCVTSAYKNYCIYCDYAAVAHRVPIDWTPKDGFTIDTWRRKGYKIRKSCNVRKK